MKLKLHADRSTGRQWEREEGGDGETERERGARARKGGNESGHKDGKGMGGGGGRGRGEEGEISNTVGLATTNTLVILCLVADFMSLKIQATKLRAHKLTNSTHRICRRRSAWSWTQGLSR